MPTKRKNPKRGWSRPVKGVALALLGLTIATGPGCNRGNPQKAYDKAWTTFQHGDLAAADVEATKAYKDFHKLSADWAWKFTILRSRILYQRGLHEQALNLLSAEQATPPVGELAVQRCRFAGLAYLSLHRFSEAEQQFGEAARLCVVSDYPACGRVLVARGLLEMERGNFAQAQTRFEKTRRLARASGDGIWEAEALLNLSWATEEQTRYDEALDYAEAAHRIATEKGVADIAQTALGNMGWAYYKLGDSEKALNMFIEADRNAKSLGDLTNQVKWVADAGYAYLDDHSSQAAERAFEESLRLAQRINSRESIVTALQALAFVSEQTGKLDDAKRYADEALSMARADGNKRDETYPRLVEGRIAARQHDPAAAEAAFHEVAESPDSPVFLKWEAERSLARLYEDESHEAASQQSKHQSRKQTGENYLQQADAEYRTALNTFETARSELQHENSRLPFLTNATRIYDDYIHFLVEQGKTAEALQDAEYSRARTLSEGLGLLKLASCKPDSTKPSSAEQGSASRGAAFHPDPLNAPEVARRVGGVILFYWLGDKQSYLWAITPQKVALFTLPPAAEINAAVDRYHKALLGPLDVLETSNADGLNLYRTLVAPAQALLPKNARVFIIPDGRLNTLNFETLLVADPKPHYWIDDATVADANSLRLLAASRSSSPQRLKPQSASAQHGTAISPALSGSFHGGYSNRTGSVLLLGDAISPSADYPELRKASDEMASIEKHFSPAQQQIFARDRATPAAYLASKPEQFAYVHFVAHGTASRTSPLDSAIVLSKASAQDDSFKLYARDIIKQRLHADLVTISTCYGAGARAYSGEGLVGLSWAFLRAGAHNVIGALWEVSDVSTPQLMDELYAGLQKGQSPDSSLRAAKLSLLHSSGPFRKPFYWAPFQLYTGS